MEEWVAAGAQRLSELGRLTRGGGVREGFLRNSHPGEGSGLVWGKASLGWWGQSVGWGGGYRGCGKIEGEGSLK